MYNKIKNRETIFVVIEQTDDGGWILSRNLRAFYDKNEADYYANRLNERNNNSDIIWYEVEPLKLLELA